MLPMHLDGSSAAPHATEVVDHHHHWPNCALVEFCIGAATVLRCSEHKPGLLCKAAHGKHMRSSFEPLLETPVSTHASDIKRPVLCRSMCC